MITAVPVDTLHDRLQAALLITALVLLPFDALPAPVQIGSKGALYPVAIGAALWLLRGDWRKPTPAECRLWISVLFFSLWVFGSTLWNCLDRMAADQALQAAATAVVPLVALFCVSAWIAGVYRSRSERLFSLLRLGVLASFALAGFYALVEVGYVYGNQACANFLTATGPWFRSVGSLHGWWPPLLWPGGRVRSICAEPSFFGVYMALVVAMFVYSILQKSRMFINVIFLIFALNLILLSASKTAFVAIFVQVVLYIISILLFYNNKYFLKKNRKKRFLVAIFIIVVIMCYGLSGQNNKIIINDFTKQSNGSNAPRVVMLLAELRMMLTNPILGFGFKQMDAHYPMYLAPFARDVAEIKLWCTTFEKNPTKPSFPSLNSYTRIGAESGVPGLLLFLGIFMLPLRDGFRQLLRTPSLESLILSSTMVSLLFCWLSVDRFVTAEPYMVLGALVAQIGSVPKTV